ncbi:MULTISPECIES: sulfurtransferase complex subunit TusB [Dickeya]|uniref:Protein TusB n=1 Tax=Dickeya fangzhongdai TaxID=1778540 RepID=A0A2K8QSN5_9GAMM|nr:MULTISPECIES: sulfurtransferase complex subunit TusB [Dickeya]ATZ96105.1 sulfurtransferase complex subunit TusB [Dickeya fangzhongdai]AYH49755.1 tRNA 2-thiouridine(34) synthase TusB [Dickeya fangzhongdai]KHN57880.1 sulfur transfer complex subunit TusB [Dickeya fangzhongdai]MBO8135725.1 sulfurtransferase complex subunit TusB [Dickeya fangzhongdai]QOH49549.1 sulfurtransferase complex subunit TusB [Dickeya fangzhongdai]
MLHTLAHSPYHTDLDALLRNVGDGDAILLLQDGVIAALAGTPGGERLLSSGATVHALKEDVEARGLIAQISTTIVLIDYTEFVQLTALHSRQLAW